jgi:hypothetical protein
MWITVQIGSDLDTQFEVIIKVAGDPKCEEGLGPDAEFEAILPCQLIRGTFEQISSDPRWEEQD